MKKIGVLTGGGDAPGLNAVLRAIVLKALGNYDVEVVGIRDGFGGFIEAGGTVALDRRSVRGLLWRGGSILGCNNTYRGEPGLFVERMKELGLGGLIVVGGDGSLSIGDAMVKLGASVVGVPKTIDNDVVGTDITFGFDSALGVVTDACHRLIDTAEAHHRVMIVEVMGRHSGFIAMHGAVAGGADIALLPEIPYRVKNVARVISERSSKGRTYTIIVASEGAAPDGGETVSREITGKTRLGGIGEVLAAQLREAVQHEVRSLSLGHLQRGGPPTPFDRILGTQMGTAAVQALMSGKTGVFTAWRNNAIALTPISEAAGRNRLVSPDDPLLASARAVGLAFGD